MRRRRKKGADEKLLSYTKYVLRDDIDKLKGKWNLKFRNDNPIHVEFGTGIDGVKEDSLILDF